MVDLRTVVFLAFWCSVCLAAEAEFKVYDEQEFLVSLPGLKSVTSLSVQPKEEGAQTRTAGESRFIVNGDGIRVWGSEYSLVKGSEISYHIKYLDDGGEKEVSGTYKFDGDYDQNPYSNDDPNAGSTNQVSKDDTQDEEDEDEDDNPLLESRFGGFGGRRRGRHHLRRPNPPFGFPHGPGMPSFPHMGGPERFPPRHRPPFHRDDDHVYCHDSGERYPHRGGSGERYPHRGGSGERYPHKGGSGERYPHWGGSGERYPHGGGSGGRYPHGGGSGERYPHGGGSGESGRATARPPVKPTVETTTAYTPEIDIRFQDD